MTDLAGSVGCPLSASNVLIMQARAALARGVVNDVEIAFACADSLMLLFNALAKELGEATKAALAYGSVPTS
jgi:hypothetical protein